MTTLRITIIGLGPRGLGALQRVIRKCRTLPAHVTVEVHLVDPGEEGQGVHSTRQPDFLLTNTLASQLSMYSEGDGPTFAQWASRSGYRRFGHDYHQTGPDFGEPVGEHDYLPRRLLGEYLAFVFERTVSAPPARVNLVHHRDRAVDMEEMTAPQGMLVRLEDGYEIASDFVFLSTGHCRRLETDEDALFERFAQENRHRNDRLHYIPSPYPVDVLQRIAPGSVAAVQGMGLTAHDVIAALTNGRGGRFRGTGGALRYLPSGREPRILLLSRQCLPAAARGINQKGVSGQYEARFFTPQAIRELRRQAEAARGTRQLHFEDEVLPLLLREMGYVYRTALEQRAITPEAYEFTAEDQRALAGILDPLNGRPFADLGQCEAFFREFVAEDLREAERGNRTSALKAATDAIRDTREALREAVDFAGLTPDSHRRFTGAWVPLMNRISFGPPRRRNYELLALMEADVVRLAGGPGCRVGTDDSCARFAIETDFTAGTTTRHADALIAARLDLYHPGKDASPLTSRLLARGLIRPYSNGDFQPGGLDITPAGRVIAKDGEPVHGLWALGYPTEGPRFYTYYIPRTGQATRFAAETDAAVADMWTQLTIASKEEHDDDQPR